MVKAEQWTLAENLYNKFSDLWHVDYPTLIRMCGGLGQWKEAENLFEFMQNTDIPICVDTLEAMLFALRRTPHRTDAAIKLLDKAYTLGLKPSLNMFNSKYRCLS